MMDNCMNPMAPSDEEILGYVLDQDPLTADAKAHLASCSLCQQRLAYYAQFNHTLLTTLYRTQCPTAMQLNFYCAGNILSIDEIFSIAHHLKECPLCFTEVADIRKTLANFNPFLGDEFQPIRTMQRLPPLLRRIVASLVTGQPRLVTRSSQANQNGWPRQYRAESLNISLHLSRASNGDILLLGLFTSDDPDQSVDAFEDVVAELYPTAVSEALPAFLGMTVQPLLSSTVDDLGNLIFNAVQPGRYTMLVRLPDTEIVIEGLSIS